MKIYEVGGTLRDGILGIPNKDKDFAVECNSFAEMRDYILSHRGRIYQEREQFGTIRGQMPGFGDADFTMCRKDGFYSDGRRPDSVLPGTIYDDLARRDFTMNAIARDIDTNVIIDPYEGTLDIEDGIIVCVREPYDRFTEDGLRIIRAMRFAITKKMRLHKSIVEFLTMPDAPMYLKGVSKERVYEEFRKMYQFSTVKTWQMMNRFPLIFTYCFDEMGIRLEPTLGE